MPIILLSVLRQCLRGFDGFGLLILPLVLFPGLINDSVLIIENLGPGKGVISRVWLVRPC